MIRASQSSLRQNNSKSRSSVHLDFIPVKLNTQYREKNDADIERNAAYQLLVTENIMQMCLYVHVSACWFMPLSSRAQLRKTSLRR
jgi:hypothetical protein